MRWPWVSRGRYDDLKAAHKREVDILVTWIEQLQAQIGATNTPREGGPEPTPLSALPGMGLYVTAEEEDLIDAHQQGIIDDMAFEQGMAELGRTTATVG